MSVLPSLTEFDRELASRHVLDFIPFATPKYVAPKHLGELFDAFELAVQALQPTVIPDKAKPPPQRTVCHAPPRHGKTEGLLHFIAWALWKYPWICFSYTTYGDRLCRRKMKQLRLLLDRIGVPLITRNLNDLRTPEGGGVIAGGIKGPLIGEGIHIALIDDPIKNQVEAQSETDRESKQDWFDTGLTTRIEPGGSVFCFMHRWHPEDLAGYLIAKHGFEYLCFSAINEKGEALWPARWPVEAFLSKQKVPHVWQALYQGQPRPRGEAVFDGCFTYESLPRVYRAGYGVDLAYTKKTKSDSSIALRLLREERGHGKDGKKLKPLYYVAMVLRKKERAPRFRKRCAALHEKEPGAPWRWYAYGPELGVADLFDTEDDGVPIEAISAPGDKLIRSGPVSEAWNDGRVLVPKNAPWLEEFLEVVLGFTGVADAHDDDVDALAAAFDLLDEGGAEDDYEEPPPADAVRTGLGAMQV